MRNRDRRVNLAREHPDWLLVWEDECGFSRFAQPSLEPGRVGSKARRLRQKEPAKGDQEPKTVACYGELVEGAKQALRRFSPGQPNSRHTLAFLQCLPGAAQEKGRKVLAVIWDNVRWHKSQQARRWIKEHHRRVKREEGVRLLAWPCPPEAPG